MDVVDEQKIGTAVAQRAVDKLVAFSEKAAAKWSAAQKNKTLKSFANYLTNRYRRARQVRNLIYDSASGDLRNLYVSTTLEYSRGDLTDDELVTLVAAPPIESKAVQKSTRPALAAIIRGVAGAGKSMLMRWAFLRLCEKTSRVPILIELRDFNDAPPKDIPDLIQQEFNSHDSDISREQVELGLQSGLFALLLDGLDEIHPELEDTWHKAITGLARKFPLCPIVVSGRPVSEMLSWSEFRILDIAPLSPEDVETLVRRLEFDEAVKVRFIDECRSRLFSTHQEFLENPLLVTVMLLTHSDNGRVSSDAHEFYEDAFNALWNRHDARKEGFNRRRYCGLQKHKFLDLLSAFSASSYLRNTFSFRDSDFDTHLTRAKKITGVEVDPDAFRKDLLKSTSLCVIDGSFLRFSHRTFQEYFCALYILKQDESRTREALGQACKRFETDNVLGMVHSIDAEKFERDFVLPELETILENVETDPRYHTHYVTDSLRHFYRMRPRSEDVAAAIDVRKDMLRSGNRDIPPRLSKLLRKDVENFRDLYNRLSKSRTERERGRNLLFGDDGNTE